MLAVTRSTFVLQSTGWRDTKRADTTPDSCSGFRENTQAIVLDKRIVRGPGSSVADLLRGHTRQFCNRYCLFPKLVALNSDRSRKTSQLVGFENCQFEPLRDTHLGNWMTLISAPICEEQLSRAFLPKTFCTEIIIIILECSAWAKQSKTGL